ncbi:MAG TPA: universal stress protein [Geminicoccaceae bacterium]|nr:universal stress protein [Geminicoccaceae bacterium]
MRAPRCRAGPGCGTGPTDRRRGQDLPGDPEAARTVPAGLIVMGSHHPELKDYLLGPNAAKVMRHADCSVTVVRE